MKVRKIMAGIEEAGAYRDARWGCVVAAAALVLAAGGCLSPATLRPVAVQNSENISNYNTNVAALANAVTHEVNLHCHLEIEVARFEVSRALTELWGLWMGAQDANDQELANPKSEIYRELNKQMDEAQLARGLGSDETVMIAVAEKYPLAADIVFETPGFSPSRVITDARTLRQITRNVAEAPSLDIAYGWMDKRDKLLDQYLWVRLRSELMQAYQQGVAEFVSVVLEQGQVAAAHANSVLAYADAEPRASTLASALRDEQLQQRVLKLVEKKQGAKCATRLEEYLGKANDVLRIVDGLSNR